MTSQDFKNSGLLYLDMDEDSKPTDLETLFKEICEEMGISFEREEDPEMYEIHGQLYSLWGEDRGITASYSFSELDNGKNLEMMSFEKVSEVVVSSEYADPNVKSYIVDLKVPVDKYKSELDKICTDKTRTNDDLHMSNLMHYLLLENKPTPEELKDYHPEDGGTFHICNKTYSIELKGVKPLIKNQLS